MMKFITPILFATLFIVASAELDDPYECQDEDRGFLDAYMIEKVGRTLIDPEDKPVIQPFPYGEVFFVDKAGVEAVDGVPAKLVANIYVEFHKDKLTEKGDKDTAGNQLLELVGGFQEVYVNVPDDDKDCRANGIHIAKARINSETLKIRDYNYAKFHTPIDESTCFPSTKQGRVTRINIALKDPMTSPILNEEGNIDFCYRVGYSIGEKVEGVESNVVSFKDTKIRGKISVEGILGNFDQSVQITQLINY